MKNKVSTFLTGFPDLDTRKQKNKKRKDNYSDPNEGIKYIPTSMV